MPSSVVPKVQICVPLTWLGNFLLPIIIHRFPRPHIAGPTQGRCHAVSLSLAAPCHMGFPTLVFPGGQGRLRAVSLTEATQPEADQGSASDQHSVTPRNCRSAGSPASPAHTTPSCLGNAATQPFGAAKPRALDGTRGPGRVLRQHWSPRLGHARRWALQWPLPALPRGGNLGGERQGRGDRGRTDGPTSS